MRAGLSNRPARPRKLTGRRQDDHFIAVDNIRSSGRHHWLILPKAHVLRDIEALSPDHLGLCKRRATLLHTR